MSSSKGIGGPSSSPEEIPGLGEVSGLSQSEVSGLLHTGISNLGQLKSVLISYLGEEQGKKFYNEFMKSFAMQILEQMQQSAQQAKKASEHMRTDTQS